MPQRVYGIAVAVTGLLFVLFLLLLRYDLQRAARKGPGWKRNLVLAGILALSTLGLVSCSNNGSGIRVVGGVPAASAKELDSATEWKRLQAVWTEAQEIASGKRGDYPFDEKGKAIILKNLETVKADVDTIEKAGLVTSPEAQLLRKDLVLLVRGVEAKRPTEMRNATCYSPTMFMPAQDSVRRLTERLPLLEKLAGSEKLAPEVVEKVLATVEKDIATLENKRNLGMLSTEERGEAESLREKVRVQVGKIRAKLTDKSTAE